MARPGTAPAAPERPTRTPDEDAPWLRPRSGRLAELWELVDDAQAPVPFGPVLKAHRAVRRHPDQAEEARYLKRRLVQRFEQRHGEIINAVYCRYAIGACALTEQSLAGRPPRTLHTVLNSTSDRLLSMETRCVVLAEDSVSVLSRHRRLRPDLHASTEAIYGVMTQVLRAADLIAKPGVAAGEQKAALAAARKQVQLVTARVGLLIQRQARFTYFVGVLYGALVALLLTAGLGAASATWWSGTLNTAGLVAAGVFGVLGSVVSVFQRISTGKLLLDFTAPSTQKYLLGGLRPFVGLVSGLFVHFALLAGLAQGAGPASTTTVAFSATVGFVAGFSERFFTDMIERAGQLLTGTAAAGNPASPAAGGTDVNDDIAADIRDDELTAQPATIPPAAPGAAAGPGAVPGPGAAPAAYPPAGVPDPPGAGAGGDAPRTRPEERSA